jgi:hypothetical protein
MFWSQAISITEIAVKSSPDWHYHTGDGAAGNSDSQYPHIPQHG